MSVIGSGLNLGDDGYGTAAAHIHVASLLSQCRLVIAMFEIARREREDLEARDESDWSQALAHLSGALSYFLIHPGIDFPQARNQLIDVDLARLRALGTWMVRDEPLVSESDVRDLRAAIDGLRGAIYSADVPPTVRVLLKKLLDRLLRGLDEFASRGWSAMRECLLAVADEVDRNEEELKQHVDVGTGSALREVVKILKRIAIVVAFANDALELFGGLGGSSFLLGND